MVTPYRGAFRTWLNIYNGVFFAKIPNGVELLTFSREKIHPRCLAGLKIGFWPRVLHIELTFVPNLQIKPKKNTRPENMCDIIFEKAKGRGRKVNRRSRPNGSLKKVL